MRFNLLKRRMGISTHCRHLKTNILITKALIYIIDLKSDFTNCLMDNKQLGNVYQKPCLSGCYISKRIHLSGFTRVERSMKSLFYWLFCV